MKKVKDLKNLHGGPRKGAGRKSGKYAFKNVAKKEETVVMRIPISLVDTVEKLKKSINTKHG